MNTKRRSWLRSSLVSLALLLTIWAGCASAAVTHVVSNQGFCVGASSGGNIASSCAAPAATKTFTFTATTTGDAVLISVGCANSSLPTVALSATGWTFTQIGSVVGSATAGFMAAFKAYAPNTSAATITQTWSGGGSTCGSFINDLIDEFSGTDATNFVDASASGANTTGGCTTAVTPVASNDGLWISCNDSVTTISGGYTLGADDTQGDRAEWKILSGGAGVSQSPSWTSSGAWTEFAVAILPAGGGGATPCAHGMLGVFSCDEARR